MELGQIIKTAILVIVVSLVIGGLTYKAMNPSEYKHPVHRD